MCHIEVSRLRQASFKYLRNVTALEDFAGCKKIHDVKLRPHIYNLANDCTIISNSIITNNMLLHVSTFKMSSGSSLCLAKITYTFSGLSKIKLLKYKMINFNKMLIVQRNKRFASGCICKL